MINLNTISIITEHGKCEFYLSPIKLHEKISADISFGKVTKLYLYSDLKDELYHSNLPVEYLQMFDRSKLNLQEELVKKKMRDHENYVLFYGQSFEPYYLGDCDIDFDKKTYSNWRGNMKQFDEQYLEIIIKKIFNNGDDLDTKTIFSPTLPSNINLTKTKAKIVLPKP